MNPESWQAAFEPAPEGTPSKENKRTKEEITEDIRRVLSFRLGMSDIDNVESVLSGLFDSLVEDVEELSALYSNTHEDVTDKQMQEDSALTEVGFGGVPAVLDRIQDVKRMIISDIPEMVKDKVSAVITPPDAGVEIHAGDGSGFDKERTLIPRLKMLLFILLNDCHQEKDSIHITEGSVTEEMVRQEPYVAVEIPELQRLVLVCDEEGNRTDVFDTSNPAYMAEGKAGILLLTKEEKNKFGEMYPGVHQTLKYSDTWPDRIYGVLTEDLLQSAEMPKKVERPASFEVLPQADSSGFYVDPAGDRWGSPKSIAKEITSSHGLAMDARFKNLIGTLQGQKILSHNKNRSDQFYKIEEVRSAMETHLELSAYFRRADEKGFWTDTSGVRWGTASVILREIIGTTELVDNDNFKEILKNIQSQKILSTPHISDAYDIEKVKDAMKSHPELSLYFRVADADGFWKDESGARWGSVWAIVQDLGAGGLNREGDFKKILGGLIGKKIKSGTRTPIAYNIDEVKSAMKGDPKLGAYLRKANESGYYVDEAGERWGSLRTVLMAVSPGLYNLRATIPATKSIKIKGEKTVVDAYNTKEIYNAILADQDLSSYHDKIRAALSRI